MYKVFEELSVFGGKFECRVVDMEMLGIFINCVWVVFLFVSWLVYGFVKFLGVVFLFVGCLVGYFIF